METIGQKIKVLRKNKGISQEVLSFELDVSRQTVHKWEKDIMQPSADNIKALCAYFGVNSNYFLDGSDYTDVSEIAATEVEHKAKKKLIVFSVFTAITLLAFIISIAVTVGIGLIVYSDNLGFVKVSLLVMENYVFVLFLLLSIILLAISVMMALYIWKCKQIFTDK